MLAKVASTDDPDVDRRGRRRAARSSGDWSRCRAPRERKRVLLRFAELILAHRDELALLETLDMGKPIGDSLAVDVNSTARASPGTRRRSTRSTTRSRHRADALALITREPVGVVAAIVPWNFPMIMAAWKIGPALAPATRSS